MIAAGALLAALLLLAFGDHSIGDSLKQKVLDIVASEGNIKQKPVPSTDHSGNNPPQTTNSNQTSHPPAPTNQQPPKEKGWSDKAKQIPILGDIVEFTEPYYKEYVEPLYNEYVKPWGGPVVEEVVSFFDPTPSLYELFVGKDYDTDEKISGYERYGEPFVNYLLSKKIGKAGGWLSKLDKKLFDGKITNWVGDNLLDPLDKKRDEFVEWACKRDGLFSQNAIGTAYADTGDLNQKKDCLIQDIIGDEGGKKDKEKDKKKEPTPAEQDQEDKLVQDELDKIDEQGLEIDEAHAERFAQKLARENDMPIEKARNIAKKVLQGNAFNQKMRKKYPNNEVYVDYLQPKRGKDNKIVRDKDGKPIMEKHQVRVDSYKPGEEIVSRKYTQLGGITENTAKEYINELVRKYPAGAKISNVATQRKGSGHENQGLAGGTLTGDLILEVPVQTKNIPDSIKQHAKNKGVIIRDENGTILNP